MEYKPRRKLKRQFELEAVRQAAQSDKPKAQLARELGRTRWSAANVAARVREGGGDWHRQA